MKFEKILHYVECSYEDKPSFILLMSDGKEYISNGCVFIENTTENRCLLIDDYDCESELFELIESGPIEIKDVTDSRYMFSCSQITKFSSDMSSVTDSSYMFHVSPYKTK